MSTPASPPSATILLTNDDGLAPDRALILPLAQRLVQAGHTVVVVAPSEDNSACGQRVTLKQPMTLRRHAAEERKYGLVDPPNARQNGIPAGNLAVFSLDSGTPSDCIIAAAEPHIGLLAKLHVTPALTVSGLNLGQNMGNDVLYSGTFAAARQAAMYGVPSVAASLDMFHADMSKAEDVASVNKALDAATEVTLAALRAVPFPLPNWPERVLPKCGTELPETGLREAFGKGDVVLNVNVPKGWQGAYETTCLDAVVYRNAMGMDFVPGEGEEVQVCIADAEAVRMWAKGADSVAVLENGTASVTAVSTWPQPHPLAVKPHVLVEGVGEGLPGWLEVRSQVAGKTS